MGDAVAVIALREVVARYGARRAVGPVSFTAEPGITALLGPSGSGKSTLLAVLARLHELVPGAALEGRVELDGVDVATLEAGALRRRVVTILQRPTPFPMSIGENVSFALRCHGVAKAELAGRAERALRRAGLWAEVADRLGADPRTLSGGQQQRLCLARALALDPPVLLLDEPCAALDPRSTALVEETLLGLEGTTRLLVTHNLAQARRLADRCVCVWPVDGCGVVVDDGPAERVFREPAAAELAEWLSGRIG